ncbi:inner nuclear membrane protein heh2-related [Anaeramoeba flamelloides]|uniref:Inner nuclear membrane protein heh2-related n=1 Tax=Anaeramoeba flamelloides TaxID=1746091 RepID=A0ABQ8X2J5_9EUKA|nr:inner nuclear membrane protein heh2-related [Anaeramoeba flamelloides]
MDQDPNTLSVRELKSFISKYGGHHLLPADKVKKTEYIRIFQQLALSLKSKQEEESSEETEEETEETEEEFEESEKESEEEVFEEIPQQKQKQKQSRTKQMTPKKKYKKNVSLTEKKRTPKKEKYSQNNNHPTDKYYTQQKQNRRNKQIKRPISSETEEENENENEYESESESDEAQELDGELNIESSDNDDEEVDLGDNRWEQRHKSSKKNTYINIHKSQQMEKAGPKKNRSVKKKKVNNKMKSNTSGNSLKIIFGVLILISISVILYNYFYTEKNYYCDSFPDITDTKKIECTECPLNGLCEYGELMTCDLGYQKSKNKCIRDTEKKELLNQEIEELLKKRKIEFHCNEEGERPKTEYLNKEELIEILFQERVNYPTEMIELWINNFESYQQDNNFIKNDEEKGFYFAQNPGYPIQCLTKVILKKYWVTILITSILIIIISFVTIRIKQKKKLLYETEHVVNKLRSKLKNQKMLSYSSNVEPYLIVNHERDNMINPNHTKKRRNLWPLVINRIKRDARIAKKTMQYSGDQVTVWEWVDNVPTTKKKRRQKKTKIKNNNNDMGYPTWDDN